MAAPTTNPVPTAADRVFAIPEMLEHILLQLPTKELLKSRLLERRFNQAITASPQIRLKLGITMPRSEPKIWDFLGPHTITEVTAPVQPGRYEEPAKSNEWLAGHYFQLYEPNKTFFQTFGLIAPPPPAMPLHRHVRALNYKMMQYVEEEITIAHRYYRMQEREGRLFNDIGALRWKSSSLPTAEVAAGAATGAAILKDAHITNPPCFKAVVKLLWKIQDGTYGYSHIMIWNVERGNGIRLQEIGKAADDGLRRIAGKTIRGWELQVVPEFGIFPTHKERSLVTEGLLQQDAR